jgi:DNA topoisomerase-2
MTTPSKTIEETFKKTNLRDHILDLPDTYIGRTQIDEISLFVFDEETEKIKEEIIKFSQGKYKIFDEIITNARDSSVRDKSCKNISVNLDRKTGYITVWNDGSGIPVCIHKDHNIYVPELIFGNLLTSQNYNQKGKTVGGKNGYGAKLTNIYSTEFIVETVSYNDTDINNKKRKKVFYKQKFSNNMSITEKPEIKTDINQSTITYTKITYLPDYKRFEMSGMSDDMYKLLIKRCYDVAACTRNVKFMLNEKEIKFKKFDDYIKLYYEDTPDEKPKITYEKFNDRWEVGIGFNKNIGDRHVSFVNGISTFQGGTHVSFIMNNVVDKVKAYIKKDKKHKDLTISTATVKQYLTFFINCVIEDPGFNSQTKEFMNSKTSDWCNCNINNTKCKDTKCEITDEFIETLCKNGLMEEVIKMSQFKELRELDKTDGKKVSNVRHIEKLIDAELAGSRRSQEATIFFCEGDSAKTFVVAGLSVLGIDKFGVFPLKGKVLNVRNATPKQIMENKEFIDIKNILGLKQNFKYTDTSKLRYGRVIVIADQDPDGSHIKGLVMNMFEYFWPELLKINGFFNTYNTPIVKTWKKTDKAKNNILKFYSTTEYERWQKTQENPDLWEHKYFKGLGTSDNNEAKNSFYDFQDNLMEMIWETGINTEQENSENSENLEQKECQEEIKHEKSVSHLSILKAFDKSRANERKEWLHKFKKSNMLVYQPKMKISYSDFIDKELIFFSNLDNDRSIPSMMDGLKPSQRMIMFSMFKRGRRAKEIKVAQLSGYVSENTDYHHGEASLQGAIVGLAQNFTGSNNINLLEPKGQFGSRRMGGKDHASARYIYTSLEPIASKIFREEDEEILIYNYDDGKQVEPVNYAPILPLVLINGCSGIGTGFSTDILPHNPVEIVENLKNIINGKKMTEMTPWFQGFKGSIEEIGKNQFLIKGKYKIDGNKVHIEDIPVIDGWFEPYENKLNEKISQNKDDEMKIETIKRNDILPNYINMTVTFRGNELQTLYKNDTLEKYLQLSKKASMTNSHLFNVENKMKKYDDPEHIISEFYEYRLTMYQKRKDYYLQKLLNDLNIAKYKVKFIKAYINKEINFANKKIETVHKLLEDKKYPKLSYDHRDPENKRTFRYLTDMNLLTLTDEKVEELERAMEKCKMLYDTYMNTPIKELWIKELDEFLEEYKLWLVNWELYHNSNRNTKKIIKKKT